VLARPALFAVAAVAILGIAGARLRQYLPWWRAVPIIIACVIARAVSDAPVQLIAMTAFIAASEELVFRGLAVDAALGGRVTPERVLAASVVSSLAFATSHFAAGGVPWSTPAWWGYFGSGACFVLLRFEAGIETTTVLHFGINLLFATGYFGAQILPGYATLLAVAVAAPVIAAVVVPRGTAQDVKHALRVGVVVTAAHRRDLP